VRGGRKRPDGVEMVWEITAPRKWNELEDGMSRPFFCGDVTSRELRVSMRHMFDKISTDMSSRCRRKREDIHMVTRLNP
jgi:hypothetical protein